MGGRGRRWRTLNFRSAPFSSSCNRAQNSFLLELNVCSNASPRSLFKKLAKGRKEKKTDPLSFPPRRRTQKTVCTPDRQSTFEKHLLLSASPGVRENQVRRSSLRSCWLSVWGLSGRKRVGAVTVLGARSRRRRRRRAGGEQGGDVW